MITKSEFYDKMIEFGKRLISEKTTGSTPARRTPHIRRNKIERRYHDRRKTPGRREA